jgi:hypothetical protein
MITIQNILNIQTLFLTWQSNEDRNKRYFVGSLHKNEAAEYSFSYSIGSADFMEAERQGFTGYPAFKISDAVYKNNVLSTFTKRLPPRSRRDFTTYLGNHFLSSNIVTDDFALISHTGIQLPSDGFDLVPDLSEASLPFDYLMEIAGTRYNLTYEDFSQIELGSVVLFMCEDDNPYDCSAVGVYIGDKKVGFINRLMCSSIRNLLDNSDLTILVAKKSGTVERPLLHVMISAR